ncbi:hypothetical protein K227x_01910 [Rubripirellula lacrimiformis]|uniref:Uncharacterized protein n=1 Tax=Rubripirellula lacrimiformis TaxID=1930273 RepID=A0A517N3W0_9BACT|nr:hypothetical protein [Rubripirellula lacrimiformis]QDT01823.1 hypothetical protein K227x_01910 [Rubripirellula lacrimiformis]
MIDTTPFTPGERVLYDALFGASRFELKITFWDLPAPSIADVAGEYDALLLNQGHWIESRLIRAAFGSRGPWFGKAFRPINDFVGEGYNCFGTHDAPIQDLMMDTYIDHSHLVTGPSFILDYRQRNQGMIRHLVGELRVLSPSILLGMGTFGPRGRRQRRLRRVIPFALIQSGRPYCIGDSTTALATDASTPQAA